MTQPKLSILIPVTWDRLGFLGGLINAFQNQLQPLKGVIRYTEKDDEGLFTYYELITLNYGSVEIIILFDDKKFTIGEKRNMLLREAGGEYVAHFDSDDLPSDCYIEEVLKGCYSGLDCCSLVGEITTDNANPKIFRHFLGCERYEEVNGEYLRFPNHISCIRSSIAKQFKFPEKNFSEDFEWAVQLHKSGLLKTQYNIEKVIYHYKYRSIK